MKYQQDSIRDEARPSLKEIGGWALALIQLHRRIALWFARPEPRRHALLYLQGVLSDIPRKNSWHVAEHARQARPYGMQRLLSSAVWDVDGVRDESLVLTCSNVLANPPTFPVLLVCQPCQMTPIRSWASMKPASLNEANAQPECKSSSVARPGGWRTARLVSS